MEKDWESSAGVTTPISFNDSIPWSPVPKESSAEEVPESQRIPAPTPFPQIWTGNEWGGLANGTILNDRYQILSADGFFIRFFLNYYSAYDMLTGKLVQIVEYFCMENACRGENQQVVITNESTFQEGLVWFRKHVRYASSMPEGFPRLLDSFQEYGTEFAVLDVYVDKEWPLEEYLYESAPNLRFSPEDAFVFLSGAMEDISRLHNAGFIFRWLDLHSIYLKHNNKYRTGIHCFGNIGLYPDRNDDPFDNWASEPRRKFDYGFQPPECLSGKRPIGPASAVYSLCAVMVVLVTCRAVPSPIDRLYEPWNIPDGYFTEPVREILEKGLSIRAIDRQQSVEELRWKLRCALQK